MKIKDKIGLYNYLDRVFNEKDHYERERERVK